jgi:hypothetical protein
MIDLGLNQYKVKEIRYEVKEGKTVIFKLNNFNLEDVEIEETQINEDKTETSEEFEKRKTREMIDASKRLFDFTKVKKQSKKDFEEGLKELLKAEHPQTYSSGAPICERETIAQRVKKLINDVIEEDSKYLKERIKDRDKDIYHKHEPNDKLSEIKKVSDVYDSNVEFVTENDKKYDSEKVLDEAFWKKEFEKFKKNGTMKVDRKTDKIISFEPKEYEEEEKKPSTVKELLEKVKSEPIKIPNIIDIPQGVIETEATEEEIEKFKKGNYKSSDNKAIVIDNFAKDYEKKNGKIKK